VIIGAPGKSNDLESLVQPPFDAVGVERWQELAPGQIARSAKDDEDRWLGVHPVLIH
jgi:hypothetical protein